MLTIAPVASGGSDYYLAEDNYYFLGEKASCWMGTLAPAMGLEGGVQPHDFDRALAGYFPGGIRLARMSGGKNIHRPGYDLTLSAPKSVSVLGLVMGDRRFLEVHQQAVSVAMKEIEHLATTRKMRDGVKQTVLTGKILAAAFHHDTSRELDPHLHTHLILLNITEYKGRWRTLSSDKAGKSGFIETLFALQVALGKIYRHELRQRIEAMGFETVITGNNGLWEIEGVPVGLFSRRTERIRAAVGEDAPLKVRDIAALATRLQKQGLPDRSMLLADWKQRLEQNGFSYPTLLKAAAERGSRAHETLAKTQILPADVRQAVRDAISLLSEKRTRFTYSDVLNRSLNNLDARSHIVLLARQAIEEAISAQLLIPLDREKGLFTSSLHLLDELSLQDLAGRIRNETVPGMARTRCAADVLPTSLTDGRLPIAIISLAGGMQNLGKTVLEAAELARSQGHAFRVLASDKAVARFLENESLESGSVLTLNRLSQAELPEKATWIVAGAETLSVRDTVTVLDTVLRTQSQLLMIDSSGRQGTGNALQILEEAGVIRLQGTSAPVTYAVRSEPDKIQRYALLAEEYAEYFRKDETVAAQVSGPREQAALTARIRQALFEQGCLGNRTVRVDTLLPVWLDRKNRHQLDTYREGMVLEYREPEKRAVVRYIIDRVSPETRSLRLQDDAGHKTGVKLSQMNADWGLYQPHTIEVAEGEKLIWFARQGKTGSRDSVTVKTINDTSLTVRHRGKDRVISLHEPLKAGYGYVTPPGGSVQEKGVVLAAVAGREMTGRLLGTLARSGHRIRIFTSLAPEDARRRLSRFSGPRTVLSEVKQNEDELATALDTRRDALMSVTEKAVRQAVSLTQGSNVFFNRMDVIANALPLHPSLGKEVVDRELRRQIRTGELIPVPGAQGAALQRYVTAETYEAEKRIIRLVAEGLCTQSPLIAPGTVILPAGLTDGQRHASRLILESADRFVAVQGYAGVGKTTQMKAVLTALETLPAPGRPVVIGLAPTHRAVGEMVLCGIKAQTLASFLMETEREIQSGASPDFQQTLFLMDECSMVGNRDFAECLQYIANGGGRAVLCGDRDQLLSVAHGAPFTLLQERSPLDTAIMKDIVRQVPSLRPAIYALTNRCVPAALDIIRQQDPDTVPREPDQWKPAGAVIAMPQTAAQKKEEGDRVLAAVVADFTGRTAECRASTLIVTQTNADKNAVNVAIHQRLQARGKLGTETVITVLDREKTHSDRLKSVQGMAEHAGKTALINDRYYEIHVRKDCQTGGIVELVDDTGQVQLFSAFESSLRDVAIFTSRQIAISVGECVTFSRSDRERGRTAGENWRVSAVAETGEIHLTRGEITRILKPGQEMADRHLDYGYAGTTHKAQGASARYVIVLAGVEGARASLATLRETYVALSRAKEHVQVYTDNLGRWLERVSGSSDRPTAHDILLSENERMTTLARRLWKGAKPLKKMVCDRLIQDLPGVCREARVIPAGTKYPSPHIALPVFGPAGKLEAIMLCPGERDENGRLRRLSGEWHCLGENEAGFTLIQRSVSGKTREADSVSDGLMMAKSCPEEGVIVRAPKATLQDLIVRRVTGGTVTDTAGRENPGMVVSPFSESCRLSKNEILNMDEAVNAEVLRQQKEARDYSRFVAALTTREVSPLHRLYYPEVEFEKGEQNVSERHPVRQARDQEEEGLQNQHGITKAKDEPER
ncbi:conjugative transfer relaxase protein TraI [Klebsiella sp. SORGH_AS 1025]|uniref:MobF family relaxase n=1 Tax=Klebsiella variicola TaxID=244366 RepID=UPI002859DB7A|nr:MULTISPECIES: MobF family relaxase [Klebsiella]MDR6246934.1 conjugative transfer relaxase protein TraI [Klebsiella variicola]MDR6252470.1 conjugative transfer relaxase protein TraI [Klebsiella variicola]MDR6257712.1 conjugative transfer relaxase protein TraI [Klebsiella sp. SORGH_AS_0826]MDR6278900.1 conjugative transfer relaxase protein TraI [Klebsiella variicola]MDR6310669.1 conjugative transfer relaxase protein TraI [Klebsiella variicola]